MIPKLSPAVFPKVVIITPHVKLALETSEGAVRDRAKNARQSARGARGVQGSGWGRGSCGVLHLELDLHHTGGLFCLQRALRISRELK